MNLDENFQSKLVLIAEGIPDEIGQQQQAYLILFRRVAELYLLLKAKSKMH